MKNKNITQEKLINANKKFLPARFVAMIKNKFIKKVEKDRFNSKLQ